LGPESAVSQWRWSVLGPLALEAPGPRRGQAVLARRTRTADHTASTVSPRLTKQHGVQVGPPHQGCRRPRAPGQPGSGHRGRASPPVKLVSVTHRLGACRPHRPCPDVPYASGRSGHPWSATVGRRISCAAPSKDAGFPNSGSQARGGRRADNGRRDRPGRRDSACSSPYSSS
jgi:hypothetical protein